MCHFPSLISQHIVLKLTDGWGYLHMFSMMTAFLGYILPWGQMSFWGATVITNLLSAIPFCGKVCVSWMWSGFNIGASAFSFFFSFHFLLPMVMLVFVFIHLLFLHESSSSSPLLIFESLSKVKFNPYFTFKDLVNISWILILFFLSTFSPWGLGDPENWVPANPMISPMHIQPEWYFLFAYEILRSIPNKLGGVVALFLSIFVFLLFSMFPSFNIPNTSLVKMNNLLFIISLVFLTFLGSKAVSEPFIMGGKLFSLLYFLNALVLTLLSPETTFLDK